MYEKVSAIASIGSEKRVMFSDRRGVMREFREVINEMRIAAISEPLGRNATFGYFDDEGQATCLVGKAFKRLGIFPLANPMHNTTSVHAFPWGLYGFKEPNAYQKLWASNVQNAADNGEAWILAIAKADATPV